MTCFDFENRVQKLLDLRQHELSDELSAHMTHCAACHELWERFHRLHGAVAVWRAQLPTVQFADAVLESLQTERDTAANSKVIPARPMPSTLPSVPLHRPSSLTGIVALLASALALLIVVGIGWRMSANVALAKRQASSQTAIAVTSPNRSEAVVTPERVSDRQLDGLLHDARDAYVALASQAWQQVSTANLLLPPADASSPFSGDEPTQGVPEPLSRPLAPLSKELREAVDSLFQQVFNSQDSST